MESGRELDRLIAEKILGPFYNQSWSQKEYENWRKEIDNCPEYSSDLVEAWKILEHFHKKYGAANIGAGGHKSETDKEFKPSWSCEIFIDLVDENGWAKPIEGRADTAPLAICLAALAAYDKLTHPT